MGFIEQSIALGWVCVSDWQEAEPCVWFSRQEHKAQLSHFRFYRVSFQTLMMSSWACSPLSTEINASSLLSCVITFQRAAVKSSHEVKNTLCQYTASVVYLQPWLPAVLSKNSSVQKKKNTSLLKCGCAVLTCFITGEIIQQERDWLYTWALANRGPVRVEVITAACWLFCHFAFTAAVLIFCFPGTRTE